MNPDEVEINNGIPYRTRKSSLPDDEDGEVWFFEYRQNPKSREWAPRGDFRKRDGKFYFMGKEFDSGYSALALRPSMGP
jgi:hypothetical protein